MSAPRGLRIIALGPEHRDEVLRVDQAAFAFPSTEVDAQLDTAHFEWDRTFAAVRPSVGPRERPASATWSEDEDLAGVMTSYSLSLAVPGCGAGVRTTPVAGLSWVSVHPDHRRRGVLTAMIRHHLEGLHERGEAVSGLFASEPLIYRRFGYGESASGARLTLDRGSALRPIAGVDQVRTTLSPAATEGNVELVHQVFADAERLRPGRIDRPLVATQGLLRDRPERHPGVELGQLIVARRQDRPTGYAFFRRANSWTAGGMPDGTVSVIELVGLDAPSLHALWSRVLDLDLMSQVNTPIVGLDDPLLAWLVDARSVPRRTDALWLRLVDVDRAMTARGYAADVDVVFELADDLCPWNARRWHLTAAGEEVRCVPTTDEPGLQLDTRDLATAYLGGPSLASLADAGLVLECQPGAVAALSRAMRGAVEPAVPPMF
ncbi:MAG: enhanced intracellular survival protein Eis [Actinomycetales bacterium]